MRARATRDREPTPGRGAGRERDASLGRFVTAFGPPLLFFLALPLLVYALNPGAVELPKRLLLESGLIVTASVAAALWLLARLPRVGATVAAACDIVSLAIFVLLLVPNRSGEITGFADELAALGNRVPLLKIGALIVLGALAYRCRPRQFRALAQSVVATAALGAALGALFVTSAADRARRGTEAEARRFLALGRDQNVIVLVLDSFTGYRMVEIVEARPEIRAALAGFTLYPRAIASALNTPAGSSAILTGSLEYAIEVDKETVRNTLSLDNSFLAEAQRQGVETAYVSPLRVRNARVPASDEAPFLPPEEPSFSERLRRFLEFTAVASARVLPQRGVETLERLASRVRIPERERPEADLEAAARATDLNQRARFLHRKAFDRILETLSVGDVSSKALYVFNKFSHEPWNWTEDGRFEPGAGWQSSSIFAARGIVRLAEKLRALGVWDAALVVVASDHGTVPIADQSMGGLFAEEDRPALGFNPLLMVKPPRATEPLRVSEMTVWLGDVAATARDALELPPPAGARFASRSLLLPDDPERRVTIPVFLRPDQASYHGPLKSWLRVDFSGTFAELGRAVSIDPDLLLSRHATIALGSGRDAHATEVARVRFRDETRTVSSAWIEIGGRQIAEIEGSGVVAISDGGGRFAMRRFDDAAAGLASLLGAPAAANVFVAAVRIPRALAEERLRAALPDAASGEPVNCVFVASTHARPRSASRCSPADVELEVEWP